MRKEIKLFEDEIITYVRKSHKTYQKKKKLLELKSERSKVVGCQVNKHKSAVFLYSSNEHMITKIKYIMSFINTQKMKYIDVSLTKHA